tara:strand:+ start:94 stop:1278 length:1185 start_codon:yes stop_codon:yes gene_type:complete
MALSNVGTQGYSYDASSNAHANINLPGAPGAADNFIEKAYVAAFREGFEQAFQQTESKLQSYFETESQSTEYQYFDRIGIAEAMQDANERYAHNPTSDIDHDRRRIGLKDYELGKYIDEKDLKRVATDPMNAYTQALIASGNRKIDDIIIDKIYGSAYTGKNGTTEIKFVGGGNAAVTTSGEESPAGIVPVGDSNITVGTLTVGAGQAVGGGNLITNSGKFVVDTKESGTTDTEGFCIGGNYVPSGTAAASGLTLAKLRAARIAMLKLNAIDQEETLNCFVTSKQIDDLLGITEVVSSDFAVRKSLESGNVTSFMGFNFIVVERLPLTGGTSFQDERRCLVAGSKSLKMSIGEGLKGDMWRDPSRKNIPYLYYKLCADASRMWGEITGEIRCVE